MVRLFFRKKEEPKVERKKVFSSLPTHLQAKRTIEHCIEYKKDYSLASFDSFIAEFTKVSLLGLWEPQDEKFPRSFFTKGDMENRKMGDIYSTSIHANIIIFDEVGMVLKTEKDFRLFESWLEKNELKIEIKSKLINKWE